MCRSTRTFPNSPLCLAVTSGENPWESGVFVFCCCWFFKKIYFSLLVSEREEGRERERDRNTDAREHQLTTSCMAPIGDRAHNLGMCPDRDTNRRPLGTWVDAQPLSHMGLVRVMYLELLCIMGGKKETNKEG
uniref:Uncharacterized protein n=1 Tax=Molossus molossus TaxID=27622 RepID=A0A7J8DQD5_MOLMO|nr:hypothetical protein HJG59_009259 [Molossus molossus]